MSTTYQFTEIHKHANGGSVGVDMEAGYGFWEWKDGSEGGGLWFEEADGAAYLSDFDGAGQLPRRVIDALRAHGITVDADFE